MHHLEIGRLTIRHSDRTEAAALRVRLGRLLDSAALTPPGLPPAAVLIVRRLADPLPGQMAAAGAGRLNEAWERAGREALAAVYRQAVRPIRGDVAGQAEAVLFTDEAELLACVAVDMSRSGPGTWWRRAIVRARRLTTLEGMLRRHARQGPAALAYLVHWDRARPVLASLTAAQSRRVLAALSQAYGAPDLGPALSSAGSDRPPGPTGAQVRSSAATTSNDPPPPWAKFVGPLPAAAGLEKAQAGLLGLGLLLHRRPAAVHRPDFQQALGRWWAGEEPPAARTKPDRPSLASFPALNRTEDSAFSEQAGEIAGERAAASRSGEPASQSEAGLESQPAGDSLPPLSSRKPPAGPSPGWPGRELVEGRIKDITPGRKSQTGPVRDVPKGAVSFQGPEPGLPPDTRERGAIEATPSPTPAALDRASQAGPGQAAPAPAESSGSVVDGDHSTWFVPPEAAMSAGDVASFLAEGVFTRLGGVFYLINMMTHLDLPDCFGEEWDLAGQIGPWGLLELLGRALLAPTGETFAADPVWTALAELAGRAPEALPGATFLRGDDAVHLPPAWFGMESEPVYHWAAGPDRFYLWAPAGYLLVDCPRRASPGGEQARREAQPYLATGAAPANLVEKPPAAAPHAALQETLLRGLNPDLARWLRVVLPFLRLRLQHALGGVEDVAEALLLVTGRLYVTGSHVDLAMPLERISLPVRLAGLDRDPGWLARWGRVVKFHFE